MNMNMVTSKIKSLCKLAFGLTLLVAAAAMAGYSTAAQAQAPATAAAVAPKRGTVKAVSGNSITLVTDAPDSQTVTISVVDGAKVQKLAVGSTDLKTATESQMSDVAVGDRVLASVKPGNAPEHFTSSRVVLMKSADIAQKNAAEQADWRKNGTAGIVSAVDPATGTITVAAGAKKVAVTTSSKTSFMRFAGDSVKYQDAKPGTLAQIRVKDQVQARGTKSDDGSTVQASEVVSGSFDNLSGLITSIDPAAGKITLKDLATKKMMTVEVTANTDIREMPLQMATMFAARTNGGQAGGQAAGGRGGAAASGDASGDAGAGRRSAGGDLAQMMARFPTGTLADLKTGDAVMIVASGQTAGATTVTASTVLSGVEPILTANPTGGMNLSGWNMSGGGGGTE